MDFSIRAVGPPGIEDGQVMQFMNFGIGFLFQPYSRINFSGLYIDAGLGWDLMVLFDNEMTDEDKRNHEFNQVGINLGVRLFNITQIGFFGFKTFVGYNLILGQLDNRAPPIMHNPVIGASLVVGPLGLEFCYYIPTRFSNGIPFIHFAILFRIEVEDY